MKDSQSYLTRISDALAPVGAIRIKAMFGGYGVYREDVIFGLIADEILYFKVGKENIEDYKSIGSEPFTYIKSEGKPYVMSYWKIPDSILNNPETLIDWAEKSIQISLKSRKSKKLSSTNLLAL
jgi:DNA transformation protein